MKLIGSTIRNKVLHFIFTPVCCAVFLFTPFSGISDPSLPGNAEYHPNRVIVKYTGNSQLNLQVRTALNTASDQKLTTQRTPLVHADDPIFKNTKGQSLTTMFEFFRDFQVRSLEPLVSTNFTKSQTRGLDRIYFLELEDGVLSPEYLEILNKRVDIEYAEPDYIGYGAGRICNECQLDHFMITTKDTPPVNDPLFNFQYGILNTGQTIGGIEGIAGADLNILDGWEITTGSSDVILGILDSGVPTDHPDFEGRILGGYNYVNNTENFADDHGHGTSVTSIAAANGNNAYGIAGTDWNAKVIHAKILDQNNSGFYSWWQQGIVFAVNNGAHIINMSVGGTTFSQALLDAVKNALDNNVIVVACMMNENNEITYYPAGYEGVISIGATNNRDERAEPFAWGGGSNYGDHIDFAAPGDRIASLMYTNYASGAFWSGTSMATPFVSGVISLMLSINPDLTGDEVYEILKTTTRPKVPLEKLQETEWNKFTGWGRIDASAALALTLASMQPSNNESDHPEALQELFIYPNPVNETLNIRLRNDNSLIRVLDITGREILSLVPNSNVVELELNVSELPNGVYILQAQGRSGIESQKFIIRK